MRYAVFVTTLMLDPGTDDFGYGCSIEGLTTDAQIVRAAQEDFAALNTDCGVSRPWLVDDDQLARIESALPVSKYEGESDDR